MIDLNEKAVQRLMRSVVGGKLRLGISEDFIPSQLPLVLSRFVQMFPDLRLDLTTGLSCDLLASYDAGELDLVIAKRHHTEVRGRVIWREPLAWMAAEHFVPDCSRPLPLVLLRPPCTYRQFMLETLDGARQPWELACTASSLLGVQAAVAGGVGVTVLGRSFLREGMRLWRAPSSWRQTPIVEIVLMGEDTVQPGIAESLVNLVAQALRSQPPSKLRSNATMVATCPVF